MHHREFFDIRASDFFRHSAFVIQRLMQFRFMVPMHGIKPVSGEACTLPRLDSVFPAA